MSGSTVTPPVAAPRRRTTGPFAPAGRPARSSAAARAARPTLPWALAACGGLAALTLLAPAAPTYDPWAWIVWGREILHLDLSTAFGPSWKPLPVALTTVFALFGSAAPALWVAFARAGALAGGLFAFRLARRLGGVPAGVAAAVALLVAPWYLRSGALGSSEGLQVACALAALECALDRRHARAFALGVALGLLRPEAWPFVGLYGAWLAWSERRRLALVAVGLASLPVCWLVPERLGSGDWLRAAHRAQQPVDGGPAQASNPVAEVLREAWLMLDRPMRWALVVALVVAAARRDRRVLALGLLAAAWTLLVAGMTAHGYAGNERYLMVPAALAIATGAAGLAVAARALWRRAPASVRGAARPAWALSAAGAAALTLWLAAPWREPARDTIRATSWQARMLDQLGPAVARAGGAARLRACGTATTGAYLVPAVAWHLGLHLGQVQLVPVEPGVVLRVHTVPGAEAVPALAPMGDLGRLRTLAVAPDWRILGTCRGAA